MPDPLSLRPLLVEHLDWSGWERLIRVRGVTLDRPYGTPHPRHEAIIYPIDYGYVEDTLGSDGEGLDVFVGSADGNGLVAALLTRDLRRGDRETKLVYNCTPEEIYRAHGFVNYDPTLMRGTLVMRRPMRELWT
jgi:inorganic pyrophosphatase